MEMRGAGLPQGAGNAQGADLPQDLRVPALGAAAPTQEADARGMEPYRPARRVTGEVLVRATATLRKYRAGKANLEKRLIAAEQWWKIRHWEWMEGGNPYQLKTPSAWLFNCIISKHADGIDAYPEPNVLPREEGDRQEAQILSKILPVILEQNDFEEVYSDQLWQKLKGGTGVFGVYWDKNKLNGLGDISIRQVDLLNLFWEPGVKDIQDSENMFHCALVNNTALLSKYPQLEGKLRGGGSTTVARYVYDDNVDTTDKSLVVDWYYHTYNGQKKVLHYCKYVGSEVLYATEDDPALAERGLYDHGEYPFIFDRLFPVEGSPCGFGYIDVCKNPQEAIDILNQAITTNAIVNATPRYFVRKDSGINEQEYADLSRPFVHTEGGLGEDSIRPVDATGLGEIYVSILNNKIEELKETSGNRDVNNGGTTAGVTAASGIAAMMEQSGKTSRASTRSAYRAYRRLINMCIELVRQFYDTPRKFRIVGEMGVNEYVTFDNSGMRPQRQGQDFGMDMGYRLPVFDVEVSAQKQNAYTKMSQNELALQLYGQGVFNPQLTDQALMLLDTMDFPRKESLMQKIAQNGTMAQMLAMYQQLALTLAAKYEPQVAEGLAQQIGGGPSVGGGPSAGSRTAAGGRHSAGGGKQAELRESDATTGGLKRKEHGIVANAREKAAQSTQPE